MNRRNFLKAGSLALGTVGLTTGLYAWQVEPFWLEIVELDMPVLNLPAELDGKTLMQISDIHVGNRFDYQFLIDSFETARKLKPDFVAYTGDYVSYEDEEQFAQLKEVLAYTVHGRLGTVGILGNHDYGKNWAEPQVAETIVTLLADAGIDVLRNDRADLGGLSFIGFDDVWGLNYIPERALSEYNPREASVLLCHNPDVCDEDVWEHYHGWILAGHTHGGQVKPPFLDPPVLPVKNDRYTAGKIDLHDGRMLYINRALGHLWQVRLNVRPEITLFRLRSV